jgi:HlyD family secretion protein
MPKRRPTRCRSKAVAASLVLVGLLAAACENRIEASPTTEADRRSLVAMARLEPASRVVQVGSPTDDVIQRILVSVGDRVEVGQILVLLESHALRQAELQSAELERERAALQPFEVEGQQARVRSMEAELEYARAEVDSQKGLSEKGYSAGKEFRDAELRVRRAREDLAQARAVLKRLEANLSLEQREADSRVLQASARLEQTVVRAPIAARVLRVLVNEGERVGQRAIAQLGDTDRMYAVGEVHVNDIRQVHVGQPARFSSPALPETIDGVVEEVGAMIYNNEYFGEDPTAPRGLRVIQVRVRLDDDDLARNFTNLEGQIRIFLDEVASDTSP